MSSEGVCCIIYCQLFLGVRCISCNPGMFLALEIKLLLVIYAGKGPCFSLSSGPVLRDIICWWASIHKQLNRLFGIMCQCPYLETDCLMCKCDQLAYSILFSNTLNFVVDMKFAFA